MNIIAANYYNSHRALALGQTGLLGGAIGTMISSVASSALAIGLASVYIRGSSVKGIGVVVVYFLAAGVGLIQGATRYPVHYFLAEKLNTTIKKIIVLMLEFLISTAVIFTFFIDIFYDPFHAALFYSAISFPISIIACTILGMTFSGIETLLCNRDMPKLT